MEIVLVPGIWLDGWWSFFDEEMVAGLDDQQRAALRERAILASIS